MACAEPGIYPADARSDTSVLASIKSLIDRVCDPIGRGEDTSADHPAICYVHTWHRTQDEAGCGRRLTTTAFLHYFADQKLPTESALEVTT